MMSRACHPALRRQKSRAFGSIPDGLLRSAKSHAPNKLEVKGFITDWDNRSETALTKAEAVAFITKVVAALKQEDADMVDTEASKKSSNGMLSIFISYVFNNQYHDD